MNTAGLVKLIVGLLLVILAIYSAILWWADELFVLVKGAVPVFVALVGLVFVLLSFD